MAGSSRTDAGVHALGNVAVFDTNTTIPPEKIFLALNPFLPDDIKIISSCQVPGDFHPRYCDSRKTYEYHIQTGPVQLPVKKRYSHWVPRCPEIELMQEAGQYITGRHDFQSFCAQGAQVKTTVRTVNRVEVTKNEILPGFDEIVSTVEGEGFLYNMVRIIAGTLLKVGFRGWPPEYIKEIIEGRDRRLAGETAPARGLVLKKIEHITFGLKKEEGVF